MFVHTLHCTHVKSHLTHKELNLIPELFFSEISSNCTNLWYLRIHWLFQLNRQNIVACSRLVENREKAVIGYSNIWLFHLNRLNIVACRWLVENREKAVMGYSNIWLFQLNRQNIVACSRLVENRAKAVIGQRLNVNTAGVVDLTIWGNINGEHYVDTARVSLW